jgi:hypothetical protein
LTRTRLLLVPLLTELESVIRPQLEEWADVATFDIPGVGEEPAVYRLDRQAIVDRTLVEVDRRGWDRYVLVCDGSALPVGIHVAYARPEAVKAMALGHARLCNRMGGERPTYNREVAEAFGRLADTNYKDFVRDGLTQVTHGSVGDELAERMLARVPLETGRAVWRMNLYDAEPFGPILRELDVPLLFAKHEGCLGATDEGFAEAAAAFPEARTVSVPQAPSVSYEFAVVLRQFCDEIAITEQTAERRPIE